MYPRVRSLSHAMHLNTLLSRRIATAFLGVALACLAQSQTGSTIRALEASKTIEDALSSDQTQSFEIWISAGEYLRITIEKAGLKVTARLMEPNGTKEVVMEEHYNRAQAVASRHRDLNNNEALALAGLGSVATSCGEPGQALKYLNRAYEFVHRTEPTTEASVLNELARAEGSVHHLSTALEHINAALDLTERLRGAIAGSDVRASYLVEGLWPAAALHKAQFSVSKEKSWSAPYYWAGFTLQGEWK